MKVFVIIISFVLSLPSIGQELYRTEIDKFTGDTTYISGFMPIDAGYKERVIFQVSMKKSKPINISLSLSAPGTHCFRDGSKVVFLYDNGQKDTLISNHSLNCKGSMNFVMDGYVNKLDRITESAISDIRFFSTDGYFDIQLDKSEATFLSRKQLPHVVSAIISKCQ